MGLIKRDLPSASHVQGVRVVKRGKFWERLGVERGEFDHDTAQVHVLLQFGEIHDPFEDWFRLQLYGGREIKELYLLLFLLIQGF